MKKRTGLVIVSIAPAAVLFSGCSDKSLASEPHWPDEGTQAYIEKLRAVVLSKS